MVSSGERYMLAEEAIDRARSSIESARGAIARIPDSPSDYWQGLGDESPLADAWHRANRAVEELEQAQKSIERAKRSNFRETRRAIKEETCKRSS